MTAKNQAVPVAPPQVDSRGMVVKGSRRRLSEAERQQRQRGAPSRAAASKGGSVSGKVKRRDPEHYAALTEARRAAAEERRRVVEVEAPALRARVAELEAEVAELRRKLRDVGR